MSKQAGVIGEKLEKNVTQNTVSKILDMRERVLEGYADLAVKVHEYMGEDYASTGDNHVIERCASGSGDERRPDPEVEA